jgi:hypothetical protein
MRIAASRHCIGAGTSSIMYLSMSQELSRLQLLLHQQSASFILLTQQFSVLCYECLNMRVGNSRHSSSLRSSEASEDMRAYSPDQRTAAVVDADDIRLACNLC